MAEALCDRVLVLHRGTLVAEGTSADVKSLARLPPNASLEDAFLRLVE
jgi:ABC-type multidrug transport system ATPase subunit